MNVTPAPLQPTETMTEITSNDLAFDVLKLEIAVKKLKAQLEERRAALKQKMQDLGVKVLQTDRYKVQIIPKKVVVIEDHKAAGEALDKMNIPVAYEQVLTEQVQEVVKTFVKGDKRQGITAQELPGVIVKEMTNLRIDLVEE